MKGFRTFIIAGLMACVPGLISYFGQVNWVSLLEGFGISPTYAVPLAMAGSAAIMAGLRAFSTTPPGKDTP